MGAGGDDGQHVPRAEEGPSPEQVPASGGRGHRLGKESVPQDKTHHHPLPDRGGHDELRDGQTGQVHRHLRTYIYLSLHELFTCCMDACREVFLKTWKIQGSCR